MFTDGLMLVIQVRSSWSDVKTVCVLGERTILTLVVVTAGRKELDYNIISFFLPKTYIMLIIAII